MQYIHVKNLEKYLPGYKDRTFAWIKVYFRNATDQHTKTKHIGIFNDAELQAVPEIDRYRFLSLCLMEASLGKPVPMDDRTMAWMGWNTKKRSKTKTLLMLQRFILETADYVTQSRVEESRVEESRVDSPNSDEFRLSKLLFDEIRIRKPDFKEPDLQKWSIHTERIIRLDKRSPERIEAVIRWCQADDFWQNNILSTEKLRKQFDQLELKASKKTISQKKIKLLPIVGKHCGVRDCGMPAVYKSTSGAGYDFWRCSEHMPDKVKEKYE